MQNNETLFQRPDFALVRLLLDANQLPTADLDDLNPEHFFGYGHPDHLMGVIGLEVFQNSGLLRSLVVDDQIRGDGCGKLMVRALEKYAQTKGIDTLYLLTETAESFFASLGYKKKARSEAPDTIKHSREFKGLCSDNAALMYKVFGHC